MALRVWCVKGDDGKMQSDMEKRKRVTTEIRMNAFERLRAEEGSALVPCTCVAVLFCSQLGFFDSSFGATLG